MPISVLHIFIKIIRLVVFARLGISLSLMHKECKVDRQRRNRRRSFKTSRCLSRFATELNPFTSLPILPLTQLLVTQDLEFRSSLEFIDFNTRCVWSEQKYSRGLLLQAKQKILKMKAYEAGRRVLTGLQKCSVWRFGRSFYIHGIMVC